ncbi:PTH2-domain-containing protein [Peniophora sp. CONT]|nr:PTH2-domain-containing protein [Peniophora sp. CONT]
MATLLSTQDYTVLASLVVGGASVGYWLGTRRIHSRTIAVAGQEEDPDAEGVESDGALDSIKPRALEESKLALVVRSDLSMGKGKIAAQCSHATLACYKALASSNVRLLKHWERSGQPKVVLKCASEEEMDELQAQAQQLNLCARAIRDAGRTQIAAGSKTVLGIGPGPARLVNQVVGKLKLL